MPWAQPGSNSWEPDGGAGLGHDLGANAGRRPIYPLAELNPETALATADASHSTVRASNVLLYFGAVKPKPGGAVHAAHNHPFDTMVVVLSGRLVLEVDDEKHELTAGSAIIVPAGSWHAGYIDGDEPYVGFEVFAPVRRDYVSKTSYQLEEFANEGEYWVKPGTDSWDDPASH